MESFTRWVTHPASGLETMVWSSAQPVNVERMARACFGEDGVRRLKAIWARDTLGLSEADYGERSFSLHNKTHFISSDDGSNYR